MYPANALPTSRIGKAQSGCSTQIRKNLGNIPHTAKTAECDSPRTHSRQLRNWDYSEVSQHPMNIPKDKSHAATWGTLVLDENSLLSTQWSICPSPSAAEAYGALPLRLTLGVQFSTSFLSVVFTKLHPSPRIFIMP